MIVTAQQGEGLSRFYFSILFNRDVQPGAPTRKKPFGDIVASEPQAALVARHARLR